jgi:hypothetical protein
VIYDYSSLGWFLAGVIGLSIFQRWLHFEIQGVFFLITRRIDLALAIFSILFLPGVLLHELSHYLAARVLGVPVGRISIIPQSLPEGRLRMGYVETASTDVFRDALIGTAPLFAGSIFVAYAGLVQLGFTSVWEQLTSSNIPDIAEVINQPDFWIWFYLIFVVSSTMFPSASDRRAWVPVLLLVGSIIVLLLISGAGPWLWDQVGTTLLGLVHILSLIFVLSALVHLILLIPVWLFRLLLNRVTGLRVV